MSASAVTVRTMIDHFHPSRHVRKEFWLSACCELTMSDSDEDGTNRRYNSATVPRFEITVAAIIDSCEEAVQVSRNT